MKQDKFLTGILIGVGALVVLALVLFFTRQDKRDYLAEDTPEGVAHNYVLAVLNKDYEKAYGYLADLKYKPTYDEFRQSFLNGMVTQEQAMAAFGKVLKTLPPGYSWSEGRGFNGGGDAGAQMGFNTLIALLLIIIVMAALFESLLFPLAIFASIIFSALGVFWLFALTGTTFEIMASIGILVLMGVVVNNGIVLFEHINNLRRNGHDRTEALILGCKERLRPILMTMGTTILGMLPLSFGTTQLGGGGPAYYPMARAVVGGLAFSTIVSLIFLPTIYAALDDLRIKTSGIIARAKARAPLARFSSGS